MTSPTHLTQKQYAQLRGCAPSAVTKAVKEGRITLVLVAGKKMVDVQLADKQWAQNTRARGDSRSAAPLARAGQASRPHHFADAGNMMTGQGGHRFVGADKTIEAQGENHFLDASNMVDGQAPDYIEHALDMVPDPAQDLAPPNQHPGHQGQSGHQGHDDDEAMTYDVARRRREAAEARIAEMKQAEMEGVLIRVDSVRSSMATTISGARDALLQIPSRLAPVLAAEPDLLKVTAVMEDALRQALADLSGMEV